MCSGNLLTNIPKACERGPAVCIIAELYVTTALKPKAEMLYTHGHSGHSSSNTPVFVREREGRSATTLSFPFFPYS